MVNLRILIMAGGTGGHVFPALAVAQQLKKEGWAVHWLGTHQGLEAEIIPKASIPISYISVTGLRGKNRLTLLLAPFRLLLAFYQALRVILCVKPSIVLGMGGFASGPGGIAAWILRCPLVLHEQNAVLGTTNRLLARLAHRVLQAFPNTFSDKYQPSLTGNPIREELLRLPLPEERFKHRHQGESIRLLVIGGSQGARGLNELCPEALQLISQNERPKIWHQAGKGKDSAVEERYRILEIEARVEAFIEDIASAYTWADIVLCRAGALTISELAAVGIGSILVPFPFAIDDHQMVNGRFLEEAEAAFLVREKDLTPQKLADILVELSKDRSRLLTMAKAARKVAKVNALANVVEVCKQLTSVRGHTT